MVISGLLDDTWQLHWSTCGLWTLWQVRSSGTSAFSIQRSRLSPHSFLELSRFGCAHAATFPASVFSIAVRAVTRLYSSILVVVHASVSYNIAGKTVLLKRLTRRVLSNFALSTPFIMVNTFYADLILRWSLQKKKRQSRNHYLHLAHRQWSFQWSNSKKYIFTAFSKCVCASVCVCMCVCVCVCVCVYYKISTRLKVMNKRKGDGKRIKNCSHFKVAHRRDKKFSWVQTPTKTVFIPFFLFTSY